MLKRVIQISLVTGLLLLILIEPNQRRETLNHFTTSALRSVEQTANQAANWLDPTGQPAVNTSDIAQPLLPRFQPPATGGDGKAQAIAGALSLDF